MAEPHQRTKSGKLRRPQKAKRAVRQQRERHSGILHAGPLEEVHTDDEDEVYRQTPTDLCMLRHRILSKVAAGFGLDPASAVDKSWRRTWTIGAWKIGDSVTVCIAMMQPNVASAWVNISGVNVQSVMSAAEGYNSLCLPKSTCRVETSQGRARIQGRWSLDLASDLVASSAVKDSDVTVTSLNVSQATLFAWVAVGSDNVYLCTLTKESLKILVRYLPPWCADFEEVAVNGAVSLKVRGSNADATQLVIGSGGSVQYQGTPAHLRMLPSAMCISIRATMESVHMAQFMDSLEYRSVHSECDGVVF